MGKATIVMALLLAACGDASASEPLETVVPDAGAPADAGTEPDGGTDIAAECDFEECIDFGDGQEICQQWAEFSVNPGQTEVTVCNRPSDFSQFVEIPGAATDTCHRYIAPYYKGTATGWVMCHENTTSITVHR